MKIDSLLVSQCLDLIKSKSLNINQYHQMFRANRFGTIDLKGKETYQVCDLLIKENILSSNLSYCAYYTHWLIIRQNAILLNSFLSKVDFNELQYQSNPLFFSLLVICDLLEDNIITLSFAKKAIDLLRKYGMTNTHVSLQFKSILDKSSPESNVTNLKLLYFYCDKYKSFSELYEIDPDLFQPMDSAKIILLKLNN